MTTTARGIVGFVLLGIFVVAGFGLLQRGWYGWTIFILFPVILGGLASWI